MRIYIWLSIICLANLNAMEIEETILAALSTTQNNTSHLVDLTEFRSTIINDNSSDGWKPISMVVEPQYRSSFSAHLICFNSNLSQEESTNILNQASQETEGKVTFIFFPEFHCAFVKRFWSTFEPNSNLFLKLLSKKALKVVSSFFGCIQINKSNNTQEVDNNNTYWHATSMIIDDGKGFTLDKNDEMVSVKRPSSSIHIVQFNQFISEIDCTEIVHQAAKLAGGKVEFKLFPEFHCALIKRFWNDLTNDEHTDQSFLPYLWKHKDVRSVINLKRQ